MSKFSEYIGSQFGNPRGVVGAICCVIMNVINRAMYKNTVALVDVKSDDKILDIGFGNGCLLQRLYGKFKCDLYGIDISEDMVNAAMERNKVAADDGKLHLQIGDCCDLPFDEGIFAAVTSINTIYFWNDTAKGLSEIRHVLKPGGIFYNVVYTKEWLDKLSYTKKRFKKFEPEDLISLGSNANFEKVTVKEIVKGKSFVVMFKK
ncbi:class I SAM-dependent methyltransferase [Fibrobacter sp. HC4]|uniref:class I SAM-dependent methyltransferase n=1 Tax=Fibrobacter sp. HC4 TaxID=3239812 RepID=UPI002019AFA8|nr:methyltransferase domain-containing protein [Fibrobacter succinogenes]MCL4101269.1 2-methoxy-6-polyprenyl-1,4-benzoquinol methylase, mitochondrial [Fibrobacter succinogenes]MCQ2100304.1 methyltransferase domain-containing protein [Fibrobacter sp.]